MRHDAPPTANGAQQGPTHGALLLAAASPATALRQGLLPEPMLAEAGQLPTGQAVPARGARPLQHRTTHAHKRTNTHETARAPEPLAARRTHVVPRAAAAAAPLQAQHA